jgi:hypothetical protein
VVGTANRLQSEGGAVAGPIKGHYDGRHVSAGGVLVLDQPGHLLFAAEEWRRCARSVARSGQQDRDPIYRLMAARAARQRLAVSRALAARAVERAAREGREL